MEAYQLLRHGETVAVCKNCGRPFVAFNRSDTLYCSRPAPQDGRKSCGEYGAYYVRLEKVRHDEATHIYKQVYNCLQNRYRRTKTPESPEGDSRLKAEKEMLISYNPAAKATPPKADAHDPNYFQPEEIARVWEALENEPIKWKMMVHLFLVTGYRRGEVPGLKWSKVDWENKQIYIDCNLLYRKELGIYEDTPKTKNPVRYIRLPDQTILPILFNRFIRFAFR